MPDQRSVFVDARNSAPYLIVCAPRIVVTDAAVVVAANWDLQTFVIADAEAGESGDIDLREEARRSFLRIRAASRESQIRSALTRICFAPVVRVTCLERRIWRKRMLPRAGPAIVAVVGG